MQAIIQIKEVITHKTQTLISIIDATLMHPNQHKVELNYPQIS